MGKNMKFSFHFYKLKQEAKDRYNYRVSSIRPKYTSRVNHTMKIIELKEGYGLDVLYEFCHELGHCEIHGKIKKGFVNEVIAWIVGIFFCLYARVPFGYQYFAYAMTCLKNLHETR